MIVANEFNTPRDKRMKLKLALVMLAFLSLNSL